MTNVFRTIVIIIAVFLLMLIMGWLMQEFWNGVAVKVIRGIRKIDLVSGVVLCGMMFLVYDRVWVRWGHEKK